MGDPMIGQLLPLVFEFFLLEYIQIASATLVNMYKPKFGLGLWYFGRYQNTIPNHTKLLVWIYATWYGFTGPKLVRTMTI
jgi:hypothetical protein